jgi:hypothetical protein
LARCDFSNRRPHDGVRAGAATKRGRRKGQIGEIWPGFYGTERRVLENIRSIWKGSAHYISTWREIIMRKQSTFAIGGAVLATVLFAIFAVTAIAREHKELNGTWSLIPTKSDFAGEPVIQSGTVTIFERQGNITVSRNFVYNGPDQNYFYKYITDAPNNATIHADKDLKSKARWDHAVLEVTTTEGGATTEESYMLAEDGTLVVRVLRPGRAPINLFFERERE